ncbi:MAG: selenocysteine-specific elongation factor [Cognaticolwellia sp.]|jgi:selenocysteine-specific elongation factor
MSLPQAFVVGTAGHIDHGKSSLVRALSGHDPDRLPEEKRRGITINLGFARMPLADGRVVSFVDVPGHERLVRTMIAGAAGIDAVLFCVNAGEGVMPQTKEHLDILQLLGIKRGIVALTMADLVDEEMQELATEDVRDALVGSFLEDAPLIVTSATTGTGLDALRNALAALPVKRRSDKGPFRLPVDRSFVQKGFGVVVTGTVLSGTVEEGQELRLLPQGDKLRVRALQVHGESQPSSQAGFRTAVNLSGAEIEELPRGSVLVGPGVEGHQILDARYHHLPGAPELSSGTRVRILTGTSEVMAIVDALDGELTPGSSHLIQLRAAEALAVLPGDRFVLRRESPVTTLGGGSLLDVWAPRHRKRDHARATAELLALESGERSVLLERAGPGGLESKRAQERDLEGTQLGDRILGPIQLAQQEQALMMALRSFHAEHPLSPAVPRRSLHRGRLAALGPQAFDALLRRLQGAGQVEIEGPRLWETGWQVQLSTEQQQTAKALLAKVRAAGLQAMALEELNIEAGEEGARILAHLIEEQRLERIGARVYEAGQVQEMIGKVRAHLATHGEMTPTDFKEISGLSRRYAIPLLEWMDGQGVTKRSGSVRVVP